MTTFFKYSLATVALLLLMYMSHLNLRAQGQNEPQIPPEPQVNDQLDFLSREDSDFEANNDPEIIDADLTINGSLDVQNSIEVGLNIESNMNIVANGNIGAFGNITTGGFIGVGTDLLVGNGIAANGSMNLDGEIFWGTSGAVLRTDQGASIELRGNIGRTPYIDFSNDPNDPDADFDIRLILENDDLLRVGGGSFGWGNTGALLRTDQGASIELRGGIGQTPYIDFSNDPNNPDADFDVRLILESDDVLNMSGGSLGIGTGNVGSNRLAVNGSIAAGDIFVEGEIQMIDVPNFPDYVFEDDYDLDTLEEVEAFIQKFGHLKDIPSAEEVKEKGLGLLEMNQKLLQKIEELTLYTIQQQKELVASHERITQLEKLVEVFIQKVEEE